MVDSPKTGSNELGGAVRHARERRGMSRRDLAETTGLSYPYISQIETGYRMPSTLAMRSLADALDLRPDSLFDALGSAAARDAPSSRTAAPAPAVPHTGAPTAGHPSIAPATVGLPAGGTSGGAAAHVVSAGDVGRPQTDSAGSAARGAGTANDPGTGDLAAGASADPTANAPAGGKAGAPGGWIANRSFRRNPTPPAVAAPAAAPQAMAPPAAAPQAMAPPAAALPGTAPAAAANPAAPRERVIDQAAALLAALPAAERLPALTEVQARVVRSVVQDEVRRNAAR